MPETTAIRIDERGNEIHESWLLVRAGKVQTTGARLFDSEITHQHYVSVTVSRCSRQRSLNHDRIHSEERLLEFDMSEAQWGAFVSSFGNGTGVPATLSWFDGARVPGAPFESRLNESHREVKEAGRRALASVQESYDALADAFESGAGKKAMREALRDLGIRLSNAPSNMEFAARSLTEHVETVVTKARSDIEAMAASADGAPALMPAAPRLLDPPEET